MRDWLGRRIRGGSLGGSRVDGVLVGDYFLIYIWTRTNDNTLFLLSIGIFASILATLLSSRISLRITCMSIVILTRHSSKVLE